ncbi:MAG: DNA polymerase III subunit gamma/tau [Planctomycetia bacterium]|nr:DNA polymerase III subunit gamma/tau [Planctomycetia bacterium]
MSVGLTENSGDYVVVARRYRPQSFEELVGQDAIAAALTGAIRSDRIGHAYLFTGARGVGKTSTARILAKSLNCVHGPAPVPCNQCEICRDISAGSDVDVIEIDGASNRGIDEIRQLRQNVSVRPARARFKIYIIDEVHMLTREAFNALLKTLEEPPEHVKFIFCTTEPGKIPITVLSRCQRFDFPAIASESIHERLDLIAKSEGVVVEPDALEILARRAAGSMRDSQSLLEQLLAFAPGKTITVDDVRRMLGIVGEESLIGLLERIVGRDPAGTLRFFDTATREGVEPGTLLEQLLGVLRDAMIAAADSPPSACLYTSPSHHEKLWTLARKWRIETICAAMQMVDHSLGRMRYSTQGRALAEMVLVRLCRLENLSDLAEVLERLANGGFPEGPIVISRTVSVPGAGEATHERIQTAESSPTSGETNPERTDPGAGTEAETSIAGGEPISFPDPSPMEKVNVDAVAQAPETGGIPMNATRGTGTTSGDGRTDVPTPEKSPRPAPDPAVENLSRKKTAKSTVEPEIETAEGTAGEAGSGTGTTKKRRGTTRKTPVSREELAGKRKDSLNHPMVQKARDLFGMIPESVEPRKE